MVFLQENLKENKMAISRSNISQQITKPGKKKISPAGAIWLDGSVDYLSWTPSGKVMREYKAGKLHSGSKKGPKVKSKKQAMAIALSEARNVQKKRKK
jgi:hypothetical protein